MHAEQVPKTDIALGRRVRCNAGYLDGSIPKLIVQPDGFSDGLRRAEKPVCRRTGDNDRIGLVEFIGPGNQREMEHLQKGRVDKYASFFSETAYGGLAALGLPGDDRSVVELVGKPDHLPYAGD